MREYVQLAQTLTDLKRIPDNALWSVKMDGVRALWVPTLRGAVCPMFSRTNDVLTGLFTRYGTPIQAPNWFLNQLPLWPLDGELLWAKQMDQIFLPHGVQTSDGVIASVVHPPGGFNYIVNVDSSFSKTVSTVKKKLPVDSEWQYIQYLVFDVPTYDAIFESGRVNNNIVKNHHIVSSAMKQYMGIDPKGDKTFFGRYEFLQHWAECETLKMLNEKRSHLITCPILQSKLDISYLETYLDIVIKVGFEGLVCRDGNSTWAPRRTKNLLKYKPYLDDEGVIIGHTKGEGKYKGMLGAYVVSWLDKMGVRKEFKLSGMNDAERKEPSPEGTVITFRYRTLSDDGIPREARLVRERLDV